MNWVLFGPALPCRVLLAPGWGGVLLLTLYGGVLVVGQAFVVCGIITPAGPVDWKTLRGHLFQWDPWFLVWGLPLGVEVWHHMRAA